MSKNARHLEILIGIIVLIMGLLAFCFGIFSILKRFEFHQTFPKNISEIFFTIKYYSLLIIFPLLYSISGALLIARKKIAWIICVILNAEYVVMWLIFGLTNKNNYEDIWFVYLLCSIYTLILIGLISKPSRVYYKPTFNNWAIIILTIILLLINRFFL